MAVKPRTDTKGEYSRVSSCERIRLDESVIEELPGWLNRCEPNAMGTSVIKGAVCEIEAVLSTYQPAENIFDNAPRAANIYSAILPIRQRAKDLLFLLNDSNDVVREQLKNFGFDVFEDIDAICRLHNASLKVEKSNEYSKSRHGVPRYALEMVVVELRNIFDKYYQSTVDDIEVVPSKSCIKYATDRENSLIEYVEGCLKAVNIKCPKNLSSYIGTEISKVQFSAL